MSRRTGVGLALAALVLSGCTTTVHGVAVQGERTEASGPAGRPTAASTGGPTYDGPPADAPPGLGPLTTARAVDLTPALPGPRLWGDAAAAGPDGVAYVALRDDDYTTYRLATVAADGAVTAVQIPAMDAPDMAVLDDGRVVLAGQFRSQSQGGPGEEPDFGVQVVDPATGRGEQFVVLPYPDSVEYNYHEAALSADGATVYLFVSWSPFEHDDEPAPEDRTFLFAVDVDSGEVLAERDLADVLGAVSVYVSGVYAGGLLARPGGGVTLVFDASPSPVGEATLPTLFFFTDDLEPDGDPVLLAGVDDPAETGGVAVTPDGTVWAQVEHDDRVAVVATPDGGGSGTEVVTFDTHFSFGLVVEPAQEQALVYGDGVLPVDLTTGAAGEPLAQDCEGQGVRDLYPGRGDVGALMLGECDAPAPRTQYLWLVTG